MKTLGMIKEKLKKNYLTFNNKNFMRKLFKVVRFIIFAVLFLAIGGFITMGLWNWLIPLLFHGPELTFWQTVGLLILSKILFGGFGHRGGRRDWKREKCMHWKEKFGDNWKEKMEEKFKGMSDEEKEKFKQNFKRSFSVNIS